MGLLGSLGILDKRNIMAPAVIRAPDGLQCGYREDSSSSTIQQFNNIAVQQYSSPIIQQFKQYSSPIIQQFNNTAAR